MKAYTHHERAIAGESRVSKNEEPWSGLEGTVKGWQDFRSGGNTGKADRWAAPLDP
jgi:hypothetical protein